MRKYFIIGGIGLLILIVVVLFLLPRPRPQQKIYQSSYTATNIQFPFLASNNTVDFFTGSAFASYNLTNHTTTTLSPQFSLPPISNVEWSSAGVLFEASNSTPVDDLYPAASTLGLNPSQEYWWFYSFATQKISYVDGGSPELIVTNAQWVSGSPGVYDYVVGNTVKDSIGQTLFTDQAGVTQIEYASPTKVIYETASNTPTVKEYNLTHHTNSILLKGTIKNVAVAANGSYLVYVDHYNTGATGNTPGDLELLNLQTHKTTKVMSSFEGVTSLNNTSYLLISSQAGAGPAQLLRYTIATGALTVLQNSALNQSQPAASLWIINANNYLVDSPANLLLVFSDKPANQPLYSNYDYLIQQDIYENGFEIHYRKEGGLDVYNIYITQNPYLQYQEAALQYIRSLKIDPNLINIKWYSDSGVSPPIYVNAVPSQ